MEQLSISKSSGATVERISITLLILMSVAFKENRATRNRTSVYNLEDCRVIHYTITPQSPSIDMDVFTVVINLCIGTIDHFVGVVKNESVVHIRIVGNRSQKFDIINKSGAGNISHDVGMNFLFSFLAYSISYASVNWIRNVGQENIVRVATYHSLLYRETLAMQVTIYPHGLRKVDD